MRYTIMGFSQKSIIDIRNQGINVDVTDLTILRWFVDFSHTDKMTKITENGKTYYWISYQSIIDDLPILNIGKRMIATRLQKLVSSGILTSLLKKDCGTFTFYGFGHMYESLLCENISTVDNKLTGGCKNISNRGVNKLATGVSIDLQPKNSYTKKQNTKNYNTKDKERVGSTRFSPPSVDDVRQYCKEINSTIDPEAFVDYYTANGWVQGKGKPIKNWKAAVRTWQRREKGKIGQSDEHPGETERERRIRLAKEADARYGIVSVI